MKRIHVLAEGQTEEQFVQKVLRPYFWDRDVDLTPTILMTRLNKRGPDFRGGVTNFAKFERDLFSLLGDSGAAMITTMLDYYALPSDFPAMSTHRSADPYQRVKHLEMAIRGCFSDPRFRPFVMLHEFEALLFVDPDLVAQDMNAPAAAHVLRRARDTASGPEKVNQGPGTNPAARIKSAFPRYHKVTDGVRLAKLIGISKILEACPHFAQWHDAIESMGKRP